MDIGLLIRIVLYFTNLSVDCFVGIQSFTFGCLTETVGLTVQREGIFPFGQVWRQCCLPHTPHHHFRTLEPQILQPSVPKTHVGLVISSCTFNILNIKQEDCVQMTFKQHGGVMAL